MRRQSYWFDNTNQAMRLRRGMGDVLPRGSKIHWEGDVTGWAGAGFFTPGGLQQLDNLLRNAGFQASLDYQTYLTTWNDYRIIVDAVVPVAYANPADAFSVIKGFVWQAFGGRPEDEPRNISQQILNVPVIDPATGQMAYTGAPTYNPVADAGICSNKTGMDWISCQLGLDSTAQKLGLGVGAGVTLALAGLAVVAIIILKK